MRLEDVMPGLESVWKRCVEKYGLVPHAYRDVAHWGFGDVVFGITWDNAWSADQGATIRLPRLPRHRGDVPRALRAAADANGSFPSGCLDKRRADGVDTLSQADPARAPLVRGAAFSSAIRQMRSVRVRAAHLTKGGTVFTTPASAAPSTRMSTRGTRGS